MKRVFLDTNVFLRFFTGGKTKEHKDYSLLFQSIESEKIKGVICSVVLMEILFTLKRFYGLPKKKCIEYFERILMINDLKIKDDYDYEKALDLFKQTKAKFADCLIASLGFFKKGGTIVSYDKDFDKLGVKRRKPVEMQLN